MAVVSLVALLAMVFLDLSIPRLIQRLIDQGIHRNDMAMVLHTAALMIGFSLLNLLATVVNSNSSILVGEGVARDLRNALFEHIQRFSYANLDRFSTGNLMVRLTSDTAAVQRIFQLSLRMGLRAPLSMVGSIVLMFVTSRILALTMLPILLLTGLAIYFFSVKMEPLFLGVQKKLDRLNTVLQENIAGVRLVKAYVRRDHEGRRFDQANQDLTDRTVRVMRFMSSMTPILTLLINIGMVLVLWVGGVQAIEGTISLGQIVAFTNYLLATMHPLIMMTQLSNVLANGLASAGRIEEVLATVPGTAEPATPRDLADSPSAEVRFQDVNFHYQGTGSLRILEDISLRVEAGRTIAILGATGSGKTSLINLIPRFYDPEAGAVLMDGTDLRLLAKDALFRRIGIVPQESILFSGTVRDNIRYGRPEADEEEVVAAAQAAQAHEFILRLPKAYDTRVEERGVNLSGGQKQRLAIARALLLKPAILILDDSTSAVDVETETAIHRGIDEYLPQGTRIMVAQRISTVLNADRIVVLDQGRVAAEGTHAELLRASPVYREIYDSQLGGDPHGV